MTNWLLLDLRRTNRGISRERLEYMLYRLDVEIARVKGLGAEAGDEYLEVLKVEREAIVLELPTATSVPSQDKTNQGQERTDKVMVRSRVRASLRGELPLLPVRLGAPRGGRRRCGC